MNDIYLLIVMTGGSPKHFGGKIVTDTRPGISLVEAIEYQFGMHPQQGVIMFGTRIGEVHIPLGTVVIEAKLERKSPYYECYSNAMTGIIPLSR